MKDPRAKTICVSFAKKSSRDWNLSPRIRSFGGAWVLRWVVAFLVGVGAPRDRYEECFDRRVRCRARRGSWSGRAKHG
jgi:hypothetical protein